MSRSRNQGSHGDVLPTCPAGRPWIVAPLLLAQLWAVFLFARAAMTTATIPYPLDYGEGPVLEWALRLARHEAIYPPTFGGPPWRTTNHPPLFTVVQAPLVAAFGPSFAWGRCLSAAATAAAALFLGLTVRALTESALAGWVGGLSLLSIRFVTSWGVLARVDALGLALVAAALWVAVRHGDRTPGLVLTGALFVAAIFTKQTFFLDGPAAVGVWLWGKRRPRAAFALTGGVWTAAAVLGMAVNVASDGGFFLHIVTANLNRLDAGMGLGYLRGFAGRLPVLLVSAAAGVAVAWRRKEPARWLLGPFLAGGFVSALAVLKAGSNVNYFFELLAAAALAVGFMVASLERRPFLLGTFVLLLTAQTLAQTTETLLFLRGLETRAAQRAEVARLETLIREADGPVLADEWMGLLPLQGKMLSFQPFELSQLARAGRWDQRPFVESLLAGRFPLVLIHAPASDPRRVGSRWTPGMLEAFRSAYTVSEVVDETLVLRPAASGRGAPPGV